MKTGSFRVDTSRRPVTGRLVAGLRRVTVAIVVGGLVVVGVPGPAHAGAATFNVRDFGAKGNGSTLDDDAIDRAISAASTATGGGTVVFPPGTYQSRSIHLSSAPPTP